MKYTLGMTFWITIIICV